MKNPNNDSDAKLARRLLGYLGRHKGLFVLGVALFPIDALSVVIPPYLVQQILDVAIPTGDWHLLNVLAGVYLAALLVEYASGFAAQFALSVLGQRAMKTLRADLFAHVLKLPAAEGKPSC